MSKSNPLFVDSTKIHGDSIGTQIELDGVILYDGEKVFAKVMDGFGQTFVVSLTLCEDGTYGGRIWLNHLQSIRYQFFIEREGQILMTMPVRVDRASHMIVDRWEPEVESGMRFLAPPPDETIQSNDLPVTAPQSDEPDLGSLLVKWGF